MDQADRIRIRSFVEELLNEHDDRATFSDTESLIKSGRLDSLAVVNLVTFLESVFAVDFARVEFDPERLDTVAEIAGVIEESRSRTSIEPQTHTDERR
jgi:acyl carrier protein